MKSSRKMFAMAIVLSGASVPIAAQAQDGSTLFKQRCQMCHALDAGQPIGIGPNLSGVVGRKAGATAYNYSTALKASGLTWDAATIDRFLAGPVKLVPGTRMPISIADPKMRAAIIAYLAAQGK